MPTICIFSTFLVASRVPTESSNGERNQTQWIVKMKSARRNPREQKI